LETKTRRRPKIQADWKGNNGQDNDAASKLNVTGFVCSEEIECNSSQGEISLHFHDAYCSGPREFWNDNL